MHKQNVHEENEKVNDCQVALLLLFFWYLTKKNLLINYFVIVSCYVVTPLPHPVRSKE